MDETHVEKDVGGQCFDGRGMHNTTTGAWMAWHAHDGSFIQLVRVARIAAIDVLQRRQPLWRTRQPRRGACRLGRCHWSRGEAECGRGGAYRQ